MGVKLSFSIKNKLGGYTVKKNKMGNKKDGDSPLQEPKTICKKKSNSYEDALTEIKELKALNDDFFSHNDHLFFNREASTLTLTFSPINILSHNKIIRLDNRVVHPYKKSWYHRIQRLTDKNVDDVKDWSDFAKGKRFVIETMETKNKAFTDVDSYGASLKPIIDGFVREKLITDDNPKHLAFVFPMQRLGNNSSLIIRFKLLADVSPFLSSDFLDYLHC